MSSGVRTLLNQIRPAASLLKEKFAAYLFEQEGIWPLLTFRISFGLVAAWGALRFMYSGWIEKLIGEPTFFFNFYGFEWLPRLGVTGMYVVYILIVLSALCISLGYRYKTSIVLFLLSFTYAELYDATNYLNHYYLVILLAGLLFFIPSNTAFSLDVYLARVKKQSLVPKWMRATLLLQLGLVYFFAGLAKVNSDWLFQAMPMAIWLPEHSDLPLFGGLLAQPITAYLFSWAGCLYDLTIVFFLLYRPTRKYAYLTVIVFHLFTWVLFNIGLFPLIMMTSTLLFFSPDFHQNLLKKLVPSLRTEKANQSIVRPRNIYRLQFVLICYFLIQIMLPLRTFLYPGQSTWTEEGYRFGWRVMLVEKVGYAQFKVKDAKSDRQIMVNNLDYLTPYQAKQMAIQPDFMLQFAKYLAEYYQAEYGLESPMVTVESFVAINGRRAKRLIDQKVNLAQAKDGLLPKEWILQAQL